MQVSVITPVYNAASFVTKAVESALEQPETAEVILVEDGSPDNSLEVCQQVAAKYDRVRLFRHPNGENRGAGASRNLGMRQSTCELIAFLDADDYYLPGRFAEAKKIFHQDADCEGVYEAAGMDVNDEVGRKRWKSAHKSENHIQTMTRRIASEDLAEALIVGNCGYFILDSLVMRKTILEKSGYMCESLRLHQDTDFIIKVSCVAKLLPGRLNEPVSMWRVHDHNRISAPRSEGQKYDDRMLSWLVLYDWLKARNLSELQQKLMNNMVLYTISKARFGKNFQKYVPRAALRVFQLLVWFSKHPKVILEPKLWVSLKKIKQL